MEAPRELSIVEIRKYMIENGCKVTNHALVKHFKKYLTHPQTQNEARKQFKTYVNILATIKNENNQKFLILRKKYLNECPSEEAVERAVSAASSESAPSSPGSGSITSEGSLVSPFRQPPPYKPPPKVGAPVPVTTGVTAQRENVESYRECINEFAAAVSRIDPGRLAREQSAEEEKSSSATQKPDDKETVVEKRSVSAKSSRANSIDEQSNKENIPRFSFSSGTSAESSSGDKVSGSEGDTAENPISVKEATRKFNRMASEEEAKILSPSSKKKQEKQLFDDVPEVTLAHPKAKEWIVSMAKANYQELAKLANDYPELVKLPDPSTTALHWAAKHDNEDVVKLIAGTYKADVNARTNGGYTPLHLAMQFGRNNIFELLCNSYKANRDLMDCSGNKPLDYSQQRTTVSASTYSKIKARRKHTVEKDLGFLRIGSLNVRVKKTTEAFSNFLGVGNGNGSSLAPMAIAGGNGASGMRQTASLPHQRSHRHHHHALHHHHHAGTTRNHYLHQRHPMTTTQLEMMNNNNSNNQLSSRTSVPINSSKFDKLHKSWGSADNIPHHNSNDAGGSGDAKTMMPPPRCVDTVKKRQKVLKRSSITSSNATDSPRDSISSSNSSSNLNSGGYSSMPTTPNQLRAPIGIGLGGIVDGLADSDSDSACGFGSNWSVSGRSSLSSGNLQAPRFS